jgi:hypothetical protein
MSKRPTHVLMAPVLAVLIVALTLVIAAPVSAGHQVSLIKEGLARNQVFQKIGSPNRTRSERGKRIDIYNGFEVLYGRTNRVEKIVIEGEPDGGTSPEAEAIIVEFCIEFFEETADYIEDVEEVAKDLKDAFADFEDCQRRADDAKEQVDCVDRFARNLEGAVEASADACEAFTEDFADAFEMASDDAEEAGVSDEVLDDDRTQEKLLLGMDIVASCSQ